MSQSKCVAYPPYTGDKRLVLEGLKSVCKNVVPVNAGKGITTHTLRNLGYVLAVWGDGELLDAVDDANHSVNRTHTNYIHVTHAESMRTGKKPVVRILRLIILSGPGGRNKFKIIEEIAKVFQVMHPLLMLLISMLLMC